MDISENFASRTVVYNRPVYTRPVVYTNPVVYSHPVVYTSYSRNIGIFFAILFIIIIFISIFARPVYVY